MDLVGRDRELGVLLGTVERAAAGHGGLVLVAGDPGIGKTALCDALVGAARRSQPDARIAWTACWESGGIPPLWPWGQLLRQLVAGNAAVPAEYDPWLRHLLGAGPAPDDDPATALAWSAETVAAVLRTGPGAVLAVIDDLHWADAATLRLLVAVAPLLAALPAMVVATHRDDGAPTVLPQLLRHAHPIRLSGLGPDALGALAAAFVVAPDPSTPGAATIDPETLHRHTGGNPLFARELLQLGASTVELPALAPSARAVLGARLAGLSAECRATLEVAAVVGDEAGLDVLASVRGHEAGALLEHLDEAERARLVASVGGPTRWRFSHALGRAAVLDSLGRARRVRLHQAVGETLERLRDAGRPVDAAALAHHFTEAAPGGVAAKAVRYATAAASSAAHQLAHRDAAALLGMALAALDLDLDPGAGDRIELLLALGDAQLAAGDQAASRRAFLRAADLARSTDDHERLAHAALGVGGGGGFEVAMQDDLQVSMLQEALRAGGALPPALRSRLTARLSIALTFEATDDRRLGLADAAVVLARDAGDPATIAHALAAHCDAIAGPDHAELRLTQSTEIIELARGIGDRRLELLGSRLRVVVLAETNDMEGFDAEVDDYERVAWELRQPLYEWYVPLWRGMRALMAGDLVAAERHNDEALAVGAAAGSGNARLLVDVQRWFLAHLRNQPDEVLELVYAMLAEPPAPTVAIPVALALANAQAGRFDEARRIFDTVSSEVLATAPRDSEWLPMMCQAADVVHRLGGHPTGVWIHEQLRPYAQLCGIEGIAAYSHGLVAGLLARIDPSAERHGPDGDADVAATTDAALCREGEFWLVAWAGAEHRVRDRKGLHDLARLLGAPGQEIAAADLAGVAVVEPPGDAVLDDEARTAYAHRIRELDAALDAADAAGDAAASSRLQAERDELTATLTAAYGLGGRRRSLGSSTAERARSAVRHRLSDVLRLLEAADADLGAHLRRSVRTGAYCVYDPADPVRWRLSTGRVPGV